MPPTIPIDELYKGGKYPEGQIVNYEGTNSYRANSLEKKEAEKLSEEILTDIRRAAEVHRQVRRYAQSIIRPGIRLIDMCEKIEDMNRKLVRENGLEAGIAFPTGCSLNHVAAHYTPNPGDFTVLQQSDVMKVLLCSLLRSLY